MQYVDIAECREEVFPFIHEFLSEHEPSPEYCNEQRGMDELQKVLAFAKDDKFYPAFSDKSAYLICSIAGSQYFSNGNKRLGTAVLLFFLAINNVEVEMLS